MTLARGRHPTDRGADRARPCLVSVGATSDWAILRHGDAPFDAGAARRPHLFNAMSKANAAPRSVGAALDHPRVASGLDSGWRATCILRDPRSTLPPTVGAERCFCDPTQWRPAALNHHLLYLNGREILRRDGVTLDRGTLQGRPETLLQAVAVTWP